MSHIFTDHVWPDTHDHIATFVLESFAATAHHEQYPCPHELREGEVGRLIRQTESRQEGWYRSSDQRSTQWTKDIILPYLKHLFKACIALTHLSDRFKIAMTIMLRQPKKKDIQRTGKLTPHCLAIINRQTIGDAYSHAIRR